MSKKVIITGVSGQDGSYMADYLLENTDYEIYGMVRRAAKPDYSNLLQALKNPRFKLVVGDLSDSQSVDKVVEQIKPDYFINLAAQSFVKSSWDVPEQTMDVNATGTMRCLEAILRHAPNCRFYNAGSSEEFGDVQYSPQNEKHPLRARSPYGASKIAARQIVKTYRESFNMYAVQGYLFNHEGPRRGAEFVTRKITLGVARIYNSIQNKDWNFAPIVLGNLDAKRDWSDARDFVDGIWRMLNQDVYNSEIYLELVRITQGNLAMSYGVEYLNKNIKEYVLSSGETHTIKEFVELAFNEAGIKGVWWKNHDGLDEYLLSNDGFLATKQYHPLVVVSKEFYRPAEVDLLIGDSTLARKELEWSPKYNFQSLVKEMVASDIKSLAK